MFCTSSLLAQNTKMPFTIKMEAAPSFNLLNKDVFLKNNINMGKQLGFSFKKGISKHFALGFEAQKRDFDFKSSVLETYKYVIANSKSTSSFSTSTVFNGIINLNYYKYSKSAKNLFEFGIGAGAQRQNLGTNYLEFENPFKLGGKEVLFDAKANTNALIGQMSLQNTFFIGKRIGLTLGLKGQYEPNTFTITNRANPPQIDIEQNFAAFCKTTTIKQTISNPINLMPTVALSIQLGSIATAIGVSKPAKKIEVAKEKVSKKDKEEDKKPSTCFELKWENQPKEGKCFEEEKLNLRLKYKPNGCIFTVHMAPFDDLSKEFEITTITNNALTFSINSNLMKSNIKYVIIVRQYCEGKIINCMNYIKPVERCENVCLDGK